VFGVRVVAVGKARDRALAEACREYEKRLGRFCRLEVWEVAEEAVSARDSRATALRRLDAEAGRVRARLKAGAYLAALDAAGEPMDTAAFAARVKGLTARLPEAAFVVGGSCGLHPSVLAEADWRLSLSPLTFPHQLARLVLLEQLYRAFKIIAGEAYDK
jgi:23S rRNA (pseudouridine1915-N3)-methyltransferase